MASTDQSIGMMDGAYFVGRKEILDWINATCSINLTKVEQTCTGAVACQILDSMYPGKVPMSKVDWGANKDYEYIQNYKILQKCFTNLKIDKHVDVDRLIRGKYQDNLEFMQWFKKFYELNAAGNSYDPISQREKGKGGAQFNSKHRTTSAPSSASTSTMPRRKTSTATRTGATVSKTPPGKTTRPPAASTSLGASALTNNCGAHTEKELTQLKATNECLMNENGELRLAVEGLEKERDFYFSKLRDIEVLLQGLEDSDTNALAHDIFSILYSTDEAAEENTDDMQDIEQPITTE